MRITVQLSSSVSQRVRGGPRPAAAAALFPWLHHPLHPVHPDETDLLLESFYAVDVADRDEAARVLTRLQNDPSVEAAYIKPDDELPPA